MQKVFTDILLFLWRRMLKIASYSFCSFMFEMTQALNTIGVGYKCYNKDSSHKNGAKKFQYSVIFVDVAGCATLGNNYLALQENLNLN